MSINLDFPTSPNVAYPGGDNSVNANWLQQSLGSFWNSLFTQQEIIKGLSIAQSQELCQAYLNLTEAVFSLSVKDCPVYNREIWQPIQLYKSQLNMAPFVFQSNEAVFGPQPESDPFYQGTTFQFGRSKSPSTQVWTITPNVTIGEFSIIANKIFSPTNTYIENVDVQLGDDNTLFFTSNPFLDSRNTIINVIGPGGVPTTYTDSNNQVQQEQLLVLWLYNSGLDESNLYYNFGYIWNLNLPSSEQYKGILKSFFNIGVESATVLATKSLMAYIGGVVPIVEPVESIQYVATTEYNQVVCTDKNSYFFDLNATLLPTVVPGAVFYAGDCLTSLFSFYDNVSHSNYWQIVFMNNSTIGFANTLFLGNYQSQLFFPNSLQLITLSPSGELFFPVEGTVDDVATFEAYINQPSNKSQIIEALGLSNSTVGSDNFSSVPVNPLNFLFDNFIKNNTALFVLNFSSADQTATFLQLFQEIQNYLPAHVYVMLLITINNPPDVYANLNDCLLIPDVDTTLNADGTDSSGFMTSAAPYFYKNADVRLFALGQSPQPAGGGSLIDSAHLVPIGCNGVAASGGLSCIDGKLLTTIPSGATTQTIRQLKLIDFS